MNKTQDSEFLTQLHILNLRLKTHLLIKTFGWNYNKEREERELLLYIKWGLVYFLISQFGLNERYRKFAFKQFKNTKEIDNYFDKHFEKELLTYVLITDGGVK